MARIDDTDTKLLACDQDGRNMPPHESKNELNTAGESESKGQNEKVCKCVCVYVCVCLRERTKGDKLMEVKETRNSHPQAPTHGPKVLWPPAGHRVFFRPHRSVPRGASDKKMECTSFLSPSAYAYFSIDPEIPPEGAHSHNNECKNN